MFSFSCVWLWLFFTMFESSLNIKSHSYVYFLLSYHFFCDILQCIALDFRSFALFWWDVSTTAIHLHCVFSYSLLFFFFLKQNEIWDAFQCIVSSKWCEARFRHALTAEMSETFPSGGSMHASVKLEGIDGRAPQERVEHVA